VIFETRFFSEHEPNLSNAGDTGLFGRRVEDNAMSITLTPEVESQVRKWIGHGQFHDADIVIEKALQALAEQEQARFLKLREMIRAGVENGDSEELTPELWDRMELESEEAFMRGELPNPDVCP